LERDVVPVVVFDLDSTIFSTGPRNLRILREFVRNRTDIDAGLAARVDAIDPSLMGWDVVDDLRGLGISDAGLLAELKSFWYRRSFSAEYVLDDVPVPGAVRFVRDCHDAGSLIYYLTGRHEGGMGVGTLRALAQRGFPCGKDRCVLHLKPSFELDDRTFK